MGNTLHWRFQAVNQNVCIYDTEVDDHICKVMHFVVHVTADRSRGFWTLAPQQHQIDIPWLTVWYTAHWGGGYIQSKLYIPTLTMRNTRCSKFMILHLLSSVVLWLIENLWASHIHCQAEILFTYAMLHHTKLSEMSLYDVCYICTNYLHLNTVEPLNRHHWDHQNCPSCGGVLNSEVK